MFNISDSFVLDVQHRWFVHIRYVYYSWVVYLQDFLKWNESHLKQLLCQINDPIPLGEGAGIGQLKDVDNMAMPEGSTLYELVNTGIKHTHAAVGVVVRLRKELSLVKNIPVLIAIDQVRHNFLNQLHILSSFFGLILCLGLYYMSFYNCWYVF